MDITLTPEQQALQLEIREYMKSIMSSAMIEEMKDPEYYEGGGPEYRKGLRKMGQDGWIALSWPKEYGGREATAIEQYIFTEEVMRSGFPYPFLTTEAIGPILAEYGSDEIRETVVKGILQGEVVIAIGYSEPGAGTDLAALKTKAEKNDNGWLINGQKIWTSLANFSDYIWLAARTDSDAVKKHKGLSMFLVPKDNPGFSHTPIWTLGVRTNATYFEDLQLDDKYQIGEVNKGWRLITGQLNRERLSLVNHGPIQILYEDVATWAAETQGKDGQPIISKPWVQTNLAKVKTGLEVLRVMNWKQAWAIEENRLGMEQASVAKVYGTEYFVEVYRLLMEVLGQDATIGGDSPGALLQGRLEHRYRVGSILTFGGGCNEVQRDIISAAGLWMPRAR
ncbi:acyl-CoA dehydrogenase family protein [Endozoicomonas numazuensis]|uniref:Acyl-CoA dehydrogenase n=1 Tax=Endozoicomonas numazuensis TaxID=1137799 RepID=A0A081NGF2_9GAMM|nr:acyl-CoA dehydrogenase family protein [Endozoicomonas numazuensis]KEQ17525.1 acyl-CoA dehydrogenase [Endozoicomonas numazuensis]